MNREPKDEKIHNDPDGIEDLCNPTYQLNSETKLSSDYINSFGLLGSAKAVVGSRGLSGEDKREHILETLNTPIPSYEEYVRQRALQFGPEEQSKFDKLLSIAPKETLANLDTLRAELNAEKDHLLREFDEGKGEAVALRLHEIYQEVRKLLNET